MKKILVIPYYWPPSGGAGVQRWLKLTKYLCEINVDVHVLTVDENYASYSQLDQSLLKDIHPKVKVYKTKSFEPINYYAKLVGKENIPTSGFSNVNNQGFKQKLATAIRSNFFIPDPRRGWKNYAVKKASEIIAKEKIETVITTNTPPSVHLIGMALKKKFDIKWIADFRDPWTDIYYYNLLRHSAISKYLDARLERKVLEQSDIITTVSQGCKDSFLSKTSKISTDKIKILSNGYDQDDFEKLEKKEKKKIFTITYTGTISDQYEPQIFFEALNDLFLKNKNINITFQLIGSLSPQIKSYIEKMDFNFEFIPSVPHSEINQYQVQADLLFLAIPNVYFSKGILTGKLFEYLGTFNPIIGIGPDDGGVAQILEQCNSGRIFNRKNKQPFLDFLQNVLQMFLNNQSYPVNKTEISKFSRKYQAAQFKQLL